MVIPREAALRFIQHYQDFLSSIADPEEIRGKSVIQALVLARRRYAADPALLAQWHAKNPQRDHEIVDAIKKMQIGRWVYLKDTRHYSVFLREDTEAAYAVLGLTNRLRDITGYSGIAAHCGVFPLGKQFVCDAILDDPITLGKNTMASFTACYKTLRNNDRFHTRPAQAAHPV
jgi:hypothetical protein